MSKAQDLFRLLIQICIWWQSPNICSEGYSRFCFSVRVLFSGRALRFILKTYLYMCLGTKAQYLFCRRVMGLCLVAQDQYFLRRLSQGCLQQQRFICLYLLVETKFFFLKTVIDMYQQQSPKICSEDISLNLVSEVQYFYCIKAVFSARHNIVLNIVIFRCLVAGSQDFATVMSLCLDRAQRFVLRIILGLCPRFSSGGRICYEKCHKQSLVAETKDLL